jgi:ectoine hydroxylase-related dioxygenase (phytanoyl-CoA dioxygenase family)
MKTLSLTSKLENYNNVREALKKQGYVLIKNFFTKREICLITNPVIKVLQDEGWGYKNDNHIIPTGSVNRIGSLKFLECIKLMMQEEQLHLISLQGKLPILMKELLGEEVFAHPKKMVRICYPYNMNPNDLVLPHQDLFYIKGEKDTLIAWIPLGNYLPNCGGLEVAHGSHKMGLLPVIPNKEGRFNCAASNIEKYELDWRVAHYEIGDLLIMHSLTVHASGKNLSNHFRLSLDCRFSCLNGAINEEQLLPPYYPKLPKWSDMSGRWSFKSFVIPSSLQIESSSKSLEDIMMNSRFFFN